MTEATQEQIDDPNVAVMHDGDKIYLIELKPGELGFDETTSG